MFRRFLLTATLMFSALIGHAQEATVANGQSFGVWTVNCTAVAVGQTSCVLSQRIHRSTDNAFIAQIMAFQNPDASKTYLAARVPLGAYLPAGFAIRAETSLVELPFIWQTCEAQLCEAITEISPDFLATLSSDGTRVLGAFRPSAQAEDFVFRFMLTGVTEGLEALHKAKSE